MRRFIPSSRPSLLVATVLFTSVFTLPAQAFADDEARRAILELRQQVRQMQEQNQQARFLLADQIESIQHELTDMRGQLERIRFELDVNKQAAGGSSIQVSNPQEQAAFDQAMGLFRGGKYQESTQALNAFISNYPNSQLATEAKFYLGSSLYTTRDFRGSIAQMQQLVQEAPGNPRAPDALMIIAANQMELDDMAAAKRSLQRIVSDYPQSATADKARARLEQLP